MGGVEGLLVWVGIGVLILGMWAAIDILLGVFYDSDMRRRKGG